MDKEKKIGITVVVKGGMVTGVYADSDKVSVDVLDMDTTDSDELDEKEEEYDGLMKKVKGSVLHAVW